MTRKECFEVLELNEKAGLADVKRAYRRLAFTLHPDLNPGVPDAAKKFQRLNEAYVLLLNDKNPSARRMSASGYANPESPDDKRARQEAGKAYAQAKQRFEKGQAGQDGAESAKSDGAGSKKHVPPSRGQADEGKGREDVLKDILEDPFAKRVFEDIYRHLQQDSNTTKKAGKAPGGGINPKNSQNADGPGFISSIAGGMLGGVKSWLRRRADDEQTIAMPGHLLVPGARVRIKVRHGISDKPQTVELTLPPEFVIGQPVRLKGLGKRMGSVQGDLYLTLVGKEE